MNTNTLIRRISVPFCIEIYDLKKSMGVWYWMSADFRWDDLWYLRISFMRSDKDDI